MRLTIMRYRLLTMFQTVLLLKSTAGFFKIKTFSKVSLELSKLAYNKEAV